MAQATKFYLPIFKTGYPGGKLYTYVTGTLTPAPTYSNTTGTLNPNPVIMDSKGDTTLYIDKDIAYRFMLYDANNVLISDNFNIKQLNGDPGAPGGPTGPKGQQGRQGVQGISGVQGPVGFTGAQGDQGLPYLTKTRITSDQTIVIPAGIDAVYVSACAGGGAGASWSPYVLMTKHKNSQTFPTNAQYRLQPSGVTGAAQTGQIYNYFDFAAITFLPGSGFAGQSVFKKRIALDKTQANTLQFFLGVGGVSDPVSNNGLNGTSTGVFLNGVQVINLTGGAGGKNFFPKSTPLPVLPTDGTAIRLNRGFNTGMIYYKSNNVGVITTPATGISTYSWPTSYRKKSGSSFVLQNVELSYNCPLQYFNLANATYFAYTTSNITTLTGSSNIFGDFYSYIQDKTNLVSSEAASSTKYRRTDRAGSANMGWGAGGDTYWNPNNQQNSPDRFVNFMIPTGTTTITDITIFDQTEIKDEIIKYMRNFTVSDSFNSGVLDIPSLTDNSGVWTAIQNVDNLISSTASYMRYTGSGFYMNVRTPVMANNNQSLGGPGVNGFAILEYGDITEHFPA